MLKYLHLLQNTVAVFMLAMIIGVSFMATVALSPVTNAVQEEARVAGINESTILSDFLELRYTTTNVTGGLKTQLLRQSDKSTLLVVEIPAGESSVEQDAVVIENPNSADVVVQVSADAPVELNDYLNLYIGDSLNNYRIHGKTTPNDRVVEFTVPAKGSIVLRVGADQLLRVGYTSDVTFKFTT